MSDQVHAHFAHEHADHHVQLVKEGTFLPDSQQPVYEGVTRSTWMGTKATYSRRSRKIRFPSPKM